MGATPQGRVKNLKTFARRPNGPAERNFREFGFFWGSMRFDLVFAMETARTVVLNFALEIAASIT